VFAPTIANACSSCQGDFGEIPGRSDNARWESNPLPSPETRALYPLSYGRSYTRSAETSGCSRGGLRVASRVQIDARSASAAACRRVLTSASSRAAMSVRSCWVSARSRSVANWLVISSTARVRSANWPATLAMSSTAAISAGFYAKDLRGEWHGSRSGEREGEPGEHRQVGVKLYALKPTNAIAALHALQFGRGGSPASVVAGALESVTHGEHNDRPE